MCIRDRDERIWNFIPFVGFGWARSYGSNQHNDEIAATLGILNTFRLKDVYKRQARLNSCLLIGP